MSVIDKCICKKCGNELRYTGDYDWFCTVCGNRSTKEERNKDEMKKLCILCGTELRFGGSLGWICYKCGKIKERKDVSSMLYEGVIVEKDKDGKVEVLYTELWFDAEDAEAARMYVMQEFILEVVDEKNPTPFNPETMKVHVHPF